MATRIPYLYIFLIGYFILSCDYYTGFKALGGGVRANVDTNGFTTYAITKDNVTLEIWGGIANYRSPFFNCSINNQTNSELLLLPKNIELKSENAQVLLPRIRDDLGHVVYQNGQPFQRIAIAMNDIQKFRVSFGRDMRNDFKKVNLAIKLISADNDEADLVFEIDFEESQF